MKRFQFSLMKYFSNDNIVKRFNFKKYNKPKPTNSSDFQPIKNKKFIIDKNNITDNEEENDSNLEFKELTKEEEDNFINKILIKENQNLDSFKLEGNSKIKEEEIEEEELDLYEKLKFDYFLSKEQKNQMNNTQPKIEIEEQVESIIPIVPIVPIAPIESIKVVDNKENIVKADDLVKDIEDEILKFIPNKFPSTQIINENVKIYSKKFTIVSDEMANIKYNFKSEKEKEDKAVSSKNTYKDKITLKSLKYIHNLKLLNQTLYFPMFPTYLNKKSTLSLIFKPAYKKLKESKDLSDKLLINSFKINKSSNKIKISLFNLTLVEIRNDYFKNLINKMNTLMKIIKDSNSKKDIFKISFFTTKTNTKNKRTAYLLIYLDSFHVGTLIYDIPIGISPSQEFNINLFLNICFFDMFQNEIKEIAIYDILTTDKLEINDYLQIKKTTDSFNFIINKLLSYQLKSNLDEINQKIKKESLVQYDSPLLRLIQLPVEFKKITKVYSNVINEIGEAKILI